MSYLVQGSLDKNNNNSNRVANFDVKLENLFSNETGVRFIETELIVTKDILIYIYTSGTTGECVCVRTG